MPSQAERTRSNWSKLWLLAGIALAGAVALYTATQPWLTLSLAEGAASFGWLQLTGQQLNQSLSPIAIAALAAALALTIAGRVFARLLGVLVALLGAGVSAIALSVLRAPDAAVVGRLAEATGLVGSAEAGLVTAIRLSPLVPLALVAGSALVLLGLLVLLLAGRWRPAGRRYQTDPARGSEGGAEVSDGPNGDTNGTASAKANSEVDRIADWDAQGEGHDPSLEA